MCPYKVLYLATVLASTIFHYRNLRQRDVTLDELDALFGEGTIKDELNFQFLPIGVFDNNTAKLITNDEGTWPKPCSTHENIQFSVRRVFGDKNLKLDSIDSIDVAKIKECGYLCLVAARIRSKAALDQVVQLNDDQVPGIVLSFHASMEDKQMRESFYFYPRDGWGDGVDEEKIRYGPIKKMDCEGEIGETFQRLNKYYATFREQYPDLAQHFDHRQFKTFYEDPVEFYKVKLHMNAEADVLGVTSTLSHSCMPCTLNRCGGHQCHATVCLPGDSGGELAKFLFTPTCKTIAIPVQPRSAYHWKDCIDKNERSMLMAMAHVGEQSSQSEMLQKLYPESWRRFQDHFGFSIAVPLRSLAY